MVSVDGCLGIVYENLGSRDLLSLIVCDKAHLKDYIREFARQVRVMHSKNVDTARLKDAKQVFEAYLDRLTGHLCTPDEVGRLKRVCTGIPDRTTFIHGDCHPGNVMERDGKLILIDLSSCGYGHPVFDLAGMYSIYMTAAEDEERRKKLVPARDFTARECRTIWDTFLRAYFEGGDEAFLHKVQEQIQGFVRVRRLLRTLIVADEDLHQYDEGIVLDYKKLKTFKNPHNLIIFSLFGQHIAYRERFPDNFNKFSPTDYNRKDLTYQDLEVLASYDNATLYNDYVLETIIRLFENKEVIIIYMPDHGEECFDNSKNFGRSHKETITKNIAKYQFEIPFWIWCSELYHSNHPDIIRLIAQATNRPFFSDDLSQLLLYLGGISHADYKPELNILSPKYYSHRKRLLRGKIDYDELLSKNHKCSF